MAIGSYLTPNYSRSQSEIQGDLHKVRCPSGHARKFMANVVESLNIRIPRVSSEGDANKNRIKWNYYLQEYSVLVCKPSFFIHNAIRGKRSGHGSLVFKVADSRPTCPEFEPGTAIDPPMHVKYVEAPLVCCGSFGGGRCRLRCLLRHLTIAQIGEVCHQ
ncbi:hypothetical protein TNCV_3684591 [Trichonephila clavipes]|uniref:Uncharacterized protein n=1 Tax=Trichonephila clavipes TaxID=2585209 RepID=A0A8X6RMF3_TRICX|nr:hypothetical protein TNCV_3684591 [Trichonephila clavipes]